jgi:hypothetical protein
MRAHLEQDGRMLLHHQRRVAHPLGRTVLSGAQVPLDEDGSSMNGFHVMIRCAPYMESGNQYGVACYRIRSPVELQLCE